MSDTRFYKAVIVLEDGISGTCGAIEHEGRIWLVPKWLPFPNEGYTKPERMLPLDRLNYQRFDPPPTHPPHLAGIDIMVSDPLPRLLVFGEPSRQLRRRYGVLMRPNLRFRMGGIRH